MALSFSRIFNLLGKVMPQNQKQQPWTLSYIKGAENFKLTEYTIGQHLDVITDKFPDKAALIVRRQNIRWSYQELRHHVQSIAIGLLDLGVQPGDRVGIWSSNNIEWILTQYATAYIGAVMVCINPAYREPELEYALKISECKALICDEWFRKINHIEMLNGLMPEIKGSGAGELNCDRFPGLKLLINIGQRNESGFLKFEELFKTITEAGRAKLSETARTVDPKEPVNIQFTSGTTGNPKGAMLTHHNILNNARMTAECMNFKAGDVLCIPLPLYHCFGMTTGNLSCMTVGACAVFPGQVFEPLETLQALEQEKCTGMLGVPTMYIALLSHPDFDSFDLTSMRTGAMSGAQCPESLIREVVDKMHMPELISGYGQTETSPMNHATNTETPLDKRVMTVGTAASHTEIKIIDENGEICAVGDKGEICIRGYCVMKGYWKDPVRTSETIDEDGWLHSGDIGVMDSDGYVQIAGRKKEMIIRGGENIYPKEIEEQCLRHPDIQDAAVFGVADDYFGEEVCAWLKLKRDHNLSDKALQDYLNERMSHFKVPKYIKFVEEYPMTVTGKIQKFKMKELMESELNLST